ncbi:2-deoxy-D-gluconate 3-dehydrogenase [Rasamsonia emersonii CBS 393.64]|uniref:2-deoxy-D-gluconate 3-dehydrogenase n=1 Tax=Rasamsonia emersonii (strain ATCC 16479 / CBS 393.64 / IMI 116815) TaxID=1408163 RepID=A0A0F4YDP8_RASE3|nr:2-deoxy-D-gluconate 3-dehydrogenase [Rasamsonia emersonii CBS 393.64]KKA16284.1 2-deoxy-D-gluconate 3-dehydrogenase [Rasamsonia emersonii CBS 393.64]
MVSSFPSLFSLSGKTALVTGGTRGIGQAMAIALAEAGADIVLVQRDESNTATRDEIVNRIGRKAWIHVAELSDREAVKGIIPAVLKLGVKPDILLNCAGIQRRHPSEKFPDEDWDEVLQVNLTSVFTLSREFGAYLLSRDASEFPTGKRGTIINVASLLSFQGGITVPAYAASKGGIAQLTKALSNEWVAKGINVNAIAPGYIDTDMNVALINDPNRNAGIMARIPAGRWGKPEDFKGVVIFLASEASNYVSGEDQCFDESWDTATTLSLFHHFNSEMPWLAGLTESDTRSLVTVFKGSVAAIPNLSIESLKSMPLKVRIASLLYATQIEDLSEQPIRRAATWLVRRLETTQNAPANGDCPFPRAGCSLPELKRICSNPCVDQVDLHGESLQCCVLVSTVLSCP